VPEPPPPPPSDVMVLKIELLPLEPLAVFNLPAPPAPTVIA
jgi:hypothetical protein